MAEPNIKLDINPRFMGFFFWISLFKHFRDHKNRFTTDLQPIYNRLTIDLQFQRTNTPNHVYVLSIFFGGKGDKDTV